MARGQPVWKDAPFVNGGRDMSSPALDQDLLAILACPETKEPVALADEALLATVNAAIAAGKVTARGGSAVELALDAGLVRQDGKVLYPVRAGIPIMLIEEAIALDGLGG